MSPTTKQQKAPPRQDSLSDFEVEVINYFVNLTSTLNLRKSYGEIFGLIYASPEPLCLDYIQKRLNIARGSAGPGINFLRRLGAIKTVYLPQDRRTYYVAETSLRKLATGFLQQRILPQLESGSSILDHLYQISGNADNRKNKHQRTKLKQLRNWSDLARKWLPRAIALFEDKRALH